MPLVSVVMPAFNCAAYLEQAVESILAQTVKDLEIVLVDDGSTDGTLARARSLATRDARLHVYTQANTGGPAAPRNRGISLSTGTFVAFLDPDDVWYPSKLERQLSVLLAHPDVVLVFADADLVAADGTPTGTTYLRRVDYALKAQRHLTHEQGTVFLGGPTFFSFSSVRIAGFLTSSVMTRRSALDAQGEWFAADLAVGEDIDLFFRLLQAGSAAFIDEPLHAYRQHPASLMQDQARVLRGQVAAHARNFHRASPVLAPDDRLAYRQRVAGQYFSLGFHAFRDQDRRAARAAYRESFAWHPALGTAAAFAKTLLPDQLVRLLRR